MAGVTAAVVGGGLIAAGTIGAAAIGAASAADARGQALSKEQAAQQQWDNLKLQIPDLQARTLVLEKLQKAGQLTPELEQVIQQDNSNLNNVKADQTYTDAQKAALSKLEEVGHEGLTVQDRAALEEIKADANNREQGARNAILQDAASKGTLTGGGVLASQLANNQAQADRESLEDFRVGADARKRALEGIEQGGALATNLSTNDLNQKNKVATANDAINQFNTTNKQNVANANTTVNNQAQQYNLNNDQRIADTNVGLSNQATIYNNEQPNKVAQQNFENSKAVTAGSTGQLDKGAAMDQADAQQTQAMWNGIGQGVAKIGTGVLSSAIGGSDPTKKKTDLMAGDPTPAG
jgi:hypothetical protein